MKAAARSTIVWMAPCAKNFKAEAAASPSHDFLFRDTVDASLMEEAAAAAASTIVVSAQAVTQAFLQAWRDQQPAAAGLTLVRRGTSLGSIDLAAAKALNIAVVATPGVNSPHVAKYLVEVLGLDGAPAAAGVKAVVVGAGSVGKAVVALLNGAGVKPLVLTDTSMKAAADDAALLELQGARYGLSAEQATLRSSLPAALEGATHVAVCCATAGEPVVTDAAVAALLGADAARAIKICCISRPEAISLSALAMLPATAQLTFDYGPTVLAPVRALVGDQPNVAWTSKAMSTDACNQDLDKAVLAHLQA
jgi:hypothetical protein